MTNKCPWSIATGRYVTHYKVWDINIRSVTKSRD